MMKVKSSHIIIPVNVNGLSYPIKSHRSLHGFKTNTNISIVEHLFSMSELGSPPPTLQNKIITLKIHLRQSKATI